MKLFGNPAFLFPYGSFSAYMPEWAQFLGVEGLQPEFLPFGDNQLDHFISGFFYAVIFVEPAEDADYLFFREIIFPQNLLPIFQIVIGNANFFYVPFHMLLVEYYLPRWNLRRLFKS